MTKMVKRHLKISVWAYNFITNKITRSLETLFLLKKKKRCYYLVLLYTRLYLLKVIIKIKTIKKDNQNKQMAKSATMAMSNKILSRGHSLLKLLV